MSISASAKRKYSDSFDIVASSICEICIKQYLPLDEDLTLTSVPVYCDLCSKRVCLITDLSFSPWRDERRCSPFQGYFGLHGLEAFDAVMACIGSFLSPPERALFGVALNPTGQPTWASEIVTGKNVVALDFGDVPQALASRLNDEHLRCILINVDAKKNLKVLKLTHCVGMTGIGLEPLRGSTVLELVDVSLLKLHESPTVDSESFISEAVVLPILDSILEQGERSALKHIQFHKNWRERSSPWFEDFMSRYQGFFSTTHRNVCSRCANSAPEGFTCYLCLNYICMDCLLSAAEADPETQRVPGSYCISCEKSFCRRCIAFKQCQGDNCVSRQRDNCIVCAQTCKTCNITQCLLCTFGGTCYKCGHGYCGNFRTNCLGERCRRCNKTFCDRCIDVDFCGCDVPYCQECMGVVCNDEGF